MIENNFNSVKEDPGYGQLFAVLLRRRFWFLGAFCGALFVSIFLTLIEKPTYESSMQLLVESNYQGRRGTGEQRTLEDQFTDSNVEIDNATQINLMQSSGLLQKAVDLLRPQYPTISVSGVDGVENGLKESLSLSQVVDKGEDSREVNTKIFQVVYVDKDPIKTQKVLKAIQKVYQDYDKEQQKLRLARGLAFINEQLPLVQNKVNRAEANIERFSKNQNLVDPELQSKSLVNALSTIEENQRINRVQIQQMEARYAALQQQLALSSQNALISSRLSQSYRYQNLLNEIQRTELILAQQRQRFTNTSPVIQDLLARLQRQRTLLYVEARRVLGRSSTQQSNESERSLAAGQMGGIDLNLAQQLVEVQASPLSLRSSAQDLAQAEQQLQTKLKPFPALLSEYKRLQLEVEVNSNTLQQLLIARQEIGLDFAREGFDWQVVEEPQLGEKIGPSITKNLLLGAVVGFMLGSVAAFVREGVDDAVHNSDDLKKQIALPLLGVIPELPQVKPNQPVISLSWGKPQAIEPSIIQMVHWLPFRDSLDAVYNNIQLLDCAFTLTPILGMVDAMLVASLCSGVVLVARIDQVTRSEVVQATEMLSRSRVFGIVANEARSPTSKNVLYAEKQENLSLRLYPTLVSTQVSVNNNSSN